LRAYAEKNRIDMPSSAKGKKDVAAAVLSEIQKTYNKKNFRPLYNEIYMTSIP
jgi:hypothetical protein